ncbi:polyribonucleotide nucleotidyltransferase, partial [Patescibacteria group bacterium]|nr:polyribonucleotide nucleotidyltransferase [Patescibacteria group bacterium]
MKKIEKSAKIGGRELTLSTGHVAMQASSAVMATYGETVVLATVMAAPLHDDPGYFPLSVEYQKRLYAGGRIKGSRWVKRDGRPTDDDILTARLIDRSIRPLFPKDYKMDVQVIVTVLSIDFENSPDMVAATAVSAALTASSIPFMGPVGIVKVGLNDGKYITNPKESELKNSQMDLIVSSTKEAIVMIEAGANIVSEDVMIDGIAHAQKDIKKLNSLITDFAKAVGRKKEKVVSDAVDAGLQKKVKELTDPKLEDLISRMADKRAGYGDFDELKSAVAKTLSDDKKSDISNIIEDLFNKKIKEMILSGKRPDGRKSDELRELSAVIGVLPRTHGSAIFNRGQTQALTVATLGAPSLEQLIETAEGEESRRYIHYYSMPPFSTGETGRVGYPKRREIGHGALAERALLPVIPSKDDFPYTIGLMTEILSSNGSTSMAATCGSTLSLMDAGVPIKAPVAGVSMGLVIGDKDKDVVLTDIVGIEDGGGDMDIKVAGTKDGITALQLDVKTLKLTLDILKKAFKQAKKARLEILKVMTDAVGKPREGVSKYAPKIRIVKIDKEKIGELIGPGGRVIKGIIAATGAQVDVNDDGSVFISAETEEGLKKGVERVEAVTKDPIPGEIYKGEVKRLQSFGAFIEILPGKDGMVHVSDMSEEFVKDPADILKVGDEVEVRVVKIDDLGRINLSLMLDPAFDQKKEAMRRDGGSRSGGGDRRSGGGFSRGRSGGGFDRRSSG